VGLVVGKGKEFEFELGHGSSDKSTCLSSIKIKALPEFKPNRGRKKKKRV
jgi:hypothetical protein